MLRKVTVCHPDCIKLPNSRSKERDYNLGSPHLHLEHTKQDGFVYDKYWFDEDVSMDPVLVLQKAGKLEQLRLVAPASSCDTFIYSPIDPDYFQNLTTTVVSLRSQKHAPVNGEARGVLEFQQYRKANDAAAHMAADHFAVTGKEWKALDAVLDEYGRY